MTIACRRIPNDGDTISRTNARAIGAGPFTSPSRIPTQLPVNEGSEHTDSAVGKIKDTGSSVSHY